MINTFAIRYYCAVILEIDFKHIIALFQLYYTTKNIYSIMIDYDDNSFSFLCRNWVIINPFPIWYNCAIITEITLHISLHYCKFITQLRTIIPQWFLMININAQFKISVIINAFSIRYHCAIISEITWNISLHFSNYIKQLRTILPLWLFMIYGNPQLIFFSL